MCVMYCVLCMRSPWDALLACYNLGALRVSKKHKENNANQCMMDSRVYETTVNKHKR